MRVRKALYIGQLAVLRIEIEDRISGGQVLTVLSEGAVLDINDELHGSHRPVDLCNAIVFDPVMGCEHIVNTDRLSERMRGFRFEGEDTLAVRLIKGPGAAMDGDH